MDWGRERESWEQQKYTNILQMYEISKTIKLTKKEVCPECHFVLHCQVLPPPSTSQISDSLYQASQEAPPLSPLTPPDHCYFFDTRSF